MKESLAVALLVAALSITPVAAWELSRGDFEELHIEPLQGHKAPAFMLPDLQGKPVDLESYRGKPLMLYFWATW